MGTSSHQFSTNQPREGSWVVYLNGIETPATAVQVRSEINQIPTAHVVVAPDPLLTRLGAEDRVEATVFYKDDFHTEYSKRSPDFRLLYDGSIHARTYSNTGRGRSLTFSTADQLHLLDTINPFFLTGPTAAAMQAFGAPSGQAVSLVNSGLTFPWGMLFNGFSQPTKNKIRRPYDFVENILRACSGTQELPKLYSVVTSNFYVRQMTKINFAKRFVPSPLIETELMQVSPDSAEVFRTGTFPVLRAMRSSNVLDAIQRRVQDIGMGSTMWRSVQGLFSALYYELLPMTAPPIAQVERTPKTVNFGLVLGKPQWAPAKSTGKSDAEISAEAETLARSELIADFARSGEEFSEASASFLKAVELRKKEFVKELTAEQELDPNRPNYLLNYVTKPQWTFGIAPTCNVVFPSMIQELHFSEDYMAQPTRLYVNDLSLHSTVGNSDERTKSLGTLRYGYPEQIQREMDKKFNPGGASGTSGNPIVSGKNLLVWPEEFYKGPMCSQVQAPSWVNYVVQQIAEEQTVSEQLAQQALDEIDTLILVEKIDLGALAEAELDGRGVSYPNKESHQAALKDVDAEFRAEMLGNSAKKMEILLAQLRSRGIVDDDVTSLQDAREQLQGRARNQELQRNKLKRTLARYEFYRQRGEARSASVTMAFNPYITPGFPAFVFDDTSSGQHCVGYVLSVTHELTKESMLTTAELGYVQTFDEFIGEVFDARVGNTFDGVQEDLYAAPPTPIEELREIIQKLPRAEEYFSRLFHQAETFQSNKIKRAAFDFTKAIRFVLPGKKKDLHYSFDDIFTATVKAATEKRKKEEAEDAAKLEAVVVEKTAEIKATLEALAEGAAGELIAITASLLTEAYVDQIARKVAEMTVVEEELAYQQRLNREFQKPRDTVSSDILEKYTAVVPSQAFSAAFKSYDVAMRFVSRPVCTLDEYISFRGKWGARVNAVAYNDPVQGKGAKFYEKILKLRQGPGPPPTFDADNRLVSPTVDNLPDTRFDWETSLLNYRRKFLAGTIGQRHGEEEE